jgi:TPR repeat protein
MAMNANGIRTALFICAVSIGGSAHADFQTAMQQYSAGQYEQAHTQFLSLAQLADCSSQFNLGAMALKGQGGPKDLGSAVGWLRAAASNGCEQLVGNKVPPLEAQLTAEQSHTAADIVAHYGRDALQAQGIANPQLQCPGESPASVVSAPTPEYPRGQTRSGVVIAALTIGTDGLPRDPEILLAVPDKGFNGAAVEAWMNSRFNPAMRAGRAVPSRVQAKLVFGDGAALAKLPEFAQALPAAEKGDAHAQYLVGVAGLLDPTVGVAAAHAGQLVLQAASDGDAQSQYWIGTQERSTAECHPQADGSVWLRHAATGGNAAAQLLVARQLLSGGAADVAQARTLLGQAAAADNYYATKHAAALFATASNEALRDPAAALRLARQLSGGEIQSDPQMFEVIAAAYAVNGDFRNAALQQQTAIDKAHTLGWDTAAMSERLAAYHGGKPWHGELSAAMPRS